MFLRELFRKPSAFIPVAMSLAALLTLAFHLAVFGIARQPDEGTAAHLWQLLMVGQVPFIAVFALTWVPTSPKLGVRVLALQLVAALTAVAPVVLLGY